MVDIAKCNGTECPLKETCYRFTAPSCMERQLYFASVPYDKKKGKCKMFLAKEKKLYKRK